MKKSEENEIGKYLSEIPENLSVLIKELLETENSGRKLAARNTLAKMGSKIIPHIQTLLSSDNSALRMEAAKIIELIADKKSISLLIGLLDDAEFEIRWIAADGLIKIGRPVILPLLRSIRGGKSSLLFNRGAHHVLINVVRETQKKKITALLLSLEDYHSLGETAPVQASLALKNVFRCHE